LFLVKENIVDAIKSTFRHVWHWRFKSRKVWIEVGSRREIGPNNNTQLPPSGVANNITITKRKVVPILFFSISSIEKLKNFVAFNINRLDENELMVGPFLCVWVWGAICW
jgi:hypothetical protein